MIGLGKKLISTIFVSSLLVGNALAAEPKLSGNYIFSLMLKPPSDAISIQFIFEAKITPNKTNTSGKITVTRSSVDVNDVDGIDLGFSKGNVLNYRIEAQKLFISGFPCHRGGTLDPTTLGFQEETSSDCGSERSFDVYYANVDTNKVARYAAVYGVLGTRLANGLALANSLVAGGAIGIPVNQQSSDVILSGTLVKQ